MKLEAYTEKAMRLLGGKLPQVVYLPPALRQSKIRETAKGEVTDAPPDAKEQADRILEADPLGFLIAVMNGQPIVTFSTPLTAAKTAAGKAADTVTLDGLTVAYHFPSAADRERVAIYLNDKIQPRAPVANAQNKKAAEPGEPADAEYEAMINNANVRK